MSAFEGGRVPIPTLYYLSQLIRRLPANLWFFILEGLVLRRQYSFGDHFNHQFMIYIYLAIL